MPQSPNTIDEYIEQSEKIKMLLTLRRIGWMKKMFEPNSVKNTGIVLTSV